MSHLFLKAHVSCCESISLLEACFLADSGPKSEVEDSVPKSVLGWVVESYEARGQSGRGLSLTFDVVSGLSCAAPSLSVQLLEFRPPLIYKSSQTDIFRTDYSDSPTIRLCDTLLCETPPAVPAFI